MRDPAQEQNEEKDEMVSMCSLTAGDEVFGIDTMRVREVLGMRVVQKIPLAPGYITGVIPNRGSVLTTVSLRALLGLMRRLEWVRCWCSRTKMRGSGLG